MLRTLLVFLIAVVPTQDAPRRDTAASHRTPASISGRITEQESGQPVPRAVVTLLSADRSRYLEAVANDDGRYELTGLDPGEYAIYAGPPELHASHLRQVFGRPEPMDGFALPRSNIELKAGDVRTSVDMTLARAMAIEGRVVDPWDEPMANAELRLMRVNGAEAPMQAHSDDRGEFRLFGIARGRYRICAEPSDRFVDAPDADGGRFVRTCHPASVTEAGANDVVLTTRDVSGIDIRMRRLGAYTISGTALNAAGRPVDGAHIGAYSLDDTTISAHTTSSVGQFVLRGLTPGRYLVTGAAGVSPIPGRRVAGREPEMGFVHVDVNGGDVSGIAIPLARSETVTGRVVFKGTPVPAPKQLRMVVQTSTLPEVSRTFSRPPFSPVDDNLSFTLTEVFRLPLTVGIHGLPDGWALQAVRYDDRDVTGIATDLGNPSAPRALEVALTNRVALPSVRVMDDNGQPLTTYRLVVLPADPTRWKGATWFTDDLPSRDGTVQLRPRVPGDYLIAALGPSDVNILMRESAARIERVAEVATRVTLTEGDTRTIDLRLATLPPEIR